MVVVHHDYRRERCYSVVTDRREPSARLALACNSLNGTGSIRAGARPIPTASTWRRPQRTLRLFVLLSAVLALATSGLPARAETVNCTAITSVPAVITRPGVYCFTGSLTTSIASGSAIDIQANSKHDRGRLCREMHM